MSTSLRGCHILMFWPANGMKDKNHTHQKMKGWVKKAGGLLDLSSRVSSSVTHVVCDEATWQERNGFRERVDQTMLNPKVKIVSVDWLLDSLTTGKKASTAAYLWSKLSPIQSKLMKLFQNSTAKHVAPKKQKALDDRFALEQQELEQELKVKAREEKQIREERQAIFKRGISKAHKSAFADSHHVYTGPDDFKYEVIMFKIDMFSNSNERFTITIFESNNRPHTYATYLLHEKTAGIAESKTLVACGATFDTASNQFAKSFTELTGLVWDDRFEEHEPVGGEGFTYQVPLYGPTGRGEQFLAKGAQQHRESAPIATNVAATDEAPIADLPAQSMKRPMDTTESPQAKRMRHDNGAALYVSQET